MDKKLSIFLSYSWTEKNEAVLRFLRETSALPFVDAEDGNVDFNSGHDYFNFLHAGITKADYFVRILSGNSSQSNLNFKLSEREIIENHNLKIIHVIFEPDTFKSLYEFNPTAAVVDLSKDYKKGFAAFKTYVNPEISENLVVWPFDKLYKGKTFPLVTDAVNQEMMKQLALNPGMLRSLSPRKFEEFIATLYDAFEFEVTLTGSTRDGGVDIFAVKPGDKSIYLIECKRHRNKIELSTIRGLYGALHLYKSTMAILATTSFLTPDAMNLINTHRWELGKKDYNDLLEMLSAYSKLKKE